MVKSDLKKRIRFKSHSKNSESPSKNFLINMFIFVLQRYLCYEYWAMCYEVFLICYVRRPIFFRFEEIADCLSVRPRTDIFRFIAFDLASPGVSTSTVCGPIPSSPNTNDIPNHVRHTYKR